MARISMLIPGALLVLANAVSAKYGCGGGKMIAGNCYTKSCKGVEYVNVGTGGEYSYVSNFDDKACKMDWAKKTYGGDLAPFNEEMAIHLRGPLVLEKFAAYVPSASADAQRLRKRAASEMRHQHKRHAHAQFHHKRAVKYTTVTEICTETKWVNGSPTEVVGPKETKVRVYGNDAGNGGYGGGAGDYDGAGSGSGSGSGAGAGAGGSIPGAPAPGDTPDANPKAYTRLSYYSAATKERENLAFANNLGGAASGRFSYCFGNSLSYCAADGISAAPKDECLAPDVLIPSNKEFSIWQKAPCEGPDCGAAYGVNLKGFGGCEKTFVFQFSMPSDGKTDFNGDMSAIWALNAKIGRGLQYKESCWNTGCGEVDFWEVLSAAAKDKLTSHIHNTQGSPDNDMKKGGMGTPFWMQRPMDRNDPVVGVVSFQCSGKISISIVGKKGCFDFGKTLDPAQIQKWHAGAEQVKMLDAIKR